MDSDVDLDADVSLVDADPDATKVHPSPKDKTAKSASNEGVPLDSDILVLNPLGEIYFRVREFRRGNEAYTKVRWGNNPGKLEYEVWIDYKDRVLYDAGYMKPISAGRIASTYKANRGKYKGQDKEGLDIFCAGLGYFMKKLSTDDSLQESGGRVVGILYSGRGFPRLVLSPEVQEIRPHYPLKR